MLITRRERFSAAHRMFRPDWTDEENLRFYGQCSNPNWHGHNYVLYVTVSGTINPETGFVINLKTLSTIIKKHVIAKLDHKNLNTEVDFLNGLIVSTENIAKAIFEQLQQPIEKHQVKLHSVKIMETENNFVEYFGD